MLDPVHNAVLVESSVNRVLFGFADLALPTAQAASIEATTTVALPTVTGFGSAAASSIVATAELQRPTAAILLAVELQSVSSIVEFEAPVVVRRGIEIGSATYIPGGGAGPTLNIALATLSSTTGPYSVFIATHANGTTLTKANIENGTGDAADHLSFSDADGVVSGQALSLSTSLTNGHLSFFIRDSSDPLVESAVIKIDGVTVDATAPTISAVSGVATGATTASYSVTTNEAGGTIHGRLRAPGDAAWTASEIIGAPDLTISNVEAG